MNHKENSMFSTSSFGPELIKKKHIKLQKIYYEYNLWIINALKDMQQNKNRKWKRN